MTPEEQCYNLTQGIAMQDGSQFRCTNIVWWKNALRDRGNFENAAVLFPKHIQEKLWDVYITEKQKKTPHSTVPCEV